MKPATTPKIPGKLRKGTPAKAMKDTPIRKIVAAKLALAKPTDQNSGAAQQGAFTPPSPEMGTRVPIGAPTFYADQVADLIYGINTCKIVLGQETGSGSANVHRSATVVIPTVALLAFLEAALNGLCSPALIAELEDRVNGYQKARKSGGKGYGVLS